MSFRVWTSSGRWRNIQGAGEAARRAATSVSDGRSRVPGGGPWSFCAGDAAPTASTPSGRRWRPSRRASTRRASAPPGHGGGARAPRTAGRLRRRRARPARACRRSSRPATAPTTHEPGDQPVRPLQPAGVVRRRRARRRARRPAPSVSRSPTPTSGTSGRTARRRSALSEGRFLADREHPQRGHGDAAADEQEHAGEVEEEGPVARHPPSNRSRRANRPTASVETRSLSLP